MSKQSCVILCVCARAHRERFSSPEGSRRLFSSRVPKPCELHFTLLANPLRNPVHLLPGQKGDQLSISLSLSFTCINLSLCLAPSRLPPPPIFSPCEFQFFNVKQNARRAALFVFHFDCALNYSWQCCGASGGGVKAVDCCCRAAWFSLGVPECEGRSAGPAEEEEDDLSFVVCGRLPVYSASFVCALDGD